MSFHLLWGLVMYFSISKLGLGLSTDSVHLLFASSNFAQGRGLVSFDGSYALNWPPLYPLLLSVAHWLTGLNAFDAAHVLQAMAFLGLSFCLCVLFLKIFPGDFAMALAGNILSDLGAVVVAAFGVVGSDYIDLFLVILVVLLTADYIESESPRVFAALAVTGMLAMLQRYLGVAAIATAALSVLLFARSPVQQRLIRSTVLGLCALPASVWLLATSLVLGRRGPVSLLENFLWFSRSLLGWFLPDAVVEAHLVLSTVLLWIFLLGLAVLLYRSRHTVLPSFAVPLLLFGVVYTLTLFASASVTYFNKLTGRFLLPLYIPLIALLLLGIQAVLDAASSRPSRTLNSAATASAFAFVTLLALLALRSSVPLVVQSHTGAVETGDNTFNTLQWRNNDALVYWRGHRPAGDYLLFSNVPDAVAFYTGHSCAPSPRQYSGPYGTVEFPLEGYRQELFSSGNDVYLVWIKAEDPTYYYRPRSLAAIANIEALFEGQDGAIYRLEAKRGVSLAPSTARILKVTTAPRGYNMPP